MIVYKFNIKIFLFQYKIYEKFFIHLDNKIYLKLKS